MNKNVLLFMSSFH